MKFPKSVHAEGWLDHMETTAPTHLPDALRDGGNAPLNAPTSRVDRPAAPRVTPTMASTIDPRPQTLNERPLPTPMRPEPSATALPPQRETKLTWAIGAGAGIVLIAAVALWASHKTSGTSDVPPPVLTGSATPDTQVAAATPTDATPAASQAEEASPNTPSTSTSDSSKTTVAAAPAPAEPEPVRGGKPVTTVKPAAEPLAVARAAPRSETLAQATPQPVPRVMTQQPDALSGTGPITMPPTAAGPLTASPSQATPPATMPQPAVPPVAAATPPVLAQQAPAVEPEDSGITVKVRQALSSDSVLSAVTIAVSTDHGVVKLEGQAPDALARERATVVAAATLGVKAVDNRLTLPPVASLGSGAQTGG